MHVMTRQVQTDQRLEQDGPFWIRRGQEAKQAARRTSVGDHVQHSTKLGRLIVLAGSIAIEGIEETGD